MTSHRLPRLTRSVAGKRTKFQRSERFLLRNGGGAGTSSCTAFAETVFFITWCETWWVRFCWLKRNIEVREHCRDPGSARPLGGGRDGACVRALPRIGGILSAVESVMATEVAVGTRTISSVNPATQEILRTFVCATEDEVHSAVARVRVAQLGWNALGVRGRLEFLDEFQR